MAIDPINSTPAGLGTGNRSEGGGELANALGKNDFLKLLMAQMQAQDPLKPVSDTEFVAQLATFSGLEQQTLTNDRLLELQLAQLSSGNAQLTGFIGQSVVARGDTLTLTGGDPPPVGVQLGAAAETVEVTVTNAAGDVVSTFSKGPLGEGTHDLSWSGKDANGLALPPGEYKVSVKATGADGQPVTASALVTGVVTGVSFDNGYAELLIGERRIMPADVLSVGATPVPPPPAPDTSSGTTPLPGA